MTFIEGKSGKYKNFIKVIYIIYNFIKVMIIIYHPPNLDDFLKYCQDHTT